MKMIFFIAFVLNLTSANAYAVFNVTDISCKVYEGEFHLRERLLLKQIKQRARKGDLSHIQHYGLFRRHNSMVEVINEKGNQNTIPEKSHAAIVEGMTYFYIAAIPPGSFSDKVKWHFLYPDNSANNYGKHDFVTPQAWINEARANAQAWKKHCGL